MHCGLRKNGEWAKNDLNTLHVDAHFLRREKKISLRLDEGLVARPSR